jgi:hypothetical protein
MRKFHDLWKSEFLWLIYDSGNNVMYCDVCRKAGIPALASKKTFFIRQNMLLARLIKIPIRTIQLQYVFIRGIIINALNEREDALLRNGLLLILIRYFNPHN